MAPIFFPAAVVSIVIIPYPQGTRKQTGGWAQPTHAAIAGRNCRQTLVVHGRGASTTYFSGDANVGGFAHALLRCPDESDDFVGVWAFPERSGLSQLECAALSIRHDAYIWPGQGHLGGQIEGRRAPI